MPHFSPTGSGRDMVICQMCARMIDTTFQEPTWMEPVPGKTFNGNVCKSCMPDDYEQSSCGCCAGQFAVVKHSWGEAGIRIDCCTCVNHMDIPRGIRPGKCSYHAPKTAERTSSCPTH